MLTMGNSFARANTATCKIHLLVVGGSTSDNLDTCENLISKNIYKVNDWFVFWEVCRHKTGRHTLLKENR